MSQLIIHNYPQSPVAEKVRVALGIKGLTWRWVEIPRVPPKPDLMPLTGGFRRTPVMQVGADIYCDSQCILRELERRFPEPSFFPPGTAGMPWALSRWTDGELFKLAVMLVMGSAVDQMPAELAADRARLYLGPDGDFHAVTGDLPHIEAQIRAELGWLDQRLATGRRFILGDQPALPDVLAYKIVWFIRGRWSGAGDFLAEFPALEAWEDRVEAIGHGEHTELSSADALEIARMAEPTTSAHEDPRDPQGLSPGMVVTITPDSDSGDPLVEGVVRHVDRDTIAIDREDPRVGLVCVHFPRVGYRVHRA
ncbi:MAG: glutathione S-transferase family protein [Hyphomicrobiaceae bacterium]